MNVTTDVKAEASVMIPTSAAPGAAPLTTGLFTTMPSEVPALRVARAYQLVGERPTTDATTDL